MTVRSRAVALVGVLGLLSACDAASGELRAAGAASPSASPTARDGTLPSDLIGQWAVTGPGVDPGTALNLGDHSARVFLGCAMLYASWDAGRSGGFIAHFLGGSSDCDHTFASGYQPAWLASATSFAIDGEARLLRDADGNTLAVLAPGPRPSVPPRSVDESEADPPSVSSEDRAELDREPPDLPAGVQPATRADLIGEWRRPGRAEGAVGFQDEDSELRAAGDCPSSSGRWAVADGELLLAFGNAALIGCPPEAVNLDGVRAVGIDEDQRLVLLDAEGRKMYRLLRSTSPSPTAIPSPFPPSPTRP